VLGMWLAEDQRTSRAAPRRIVATRERWREFERLPSAGWFRVRTEPAGPNDSSALAGRATGRSRVQSVTEPSGSARLADLVSANTLLMPRL
jgi:hypothetical protein